MPVRIVMKSDALYDGIAELEWGGDAGTKASPMLLPASAVTLFSIPPLLPQVLRRTSVCAYV